MVSDRSESDLNPFKVVTELLPKALRQVIQATLRRATCFKAEEEQRVPLHSHQFGFLFRAPLTFLDVFINFVP